MKKNYIKIFCLGAAITSLLSSCGDGWFERDPKNILTNEQVWNDPAMIKSQLANYMIEFPNYMATLTQVVCVKLMMQCIVVL